jgi:SAM-dependent methyltransferase
MAIDHSLTYKKKSLRNLPHNLRLKTILKIVEHNNVQEYGKAYLDVGCSNGYITNLISSSFNFNTIRGVDHNTDNLEIAKEKYPSINFEFIDLNQLNVTNSDNYNLVTCFETLEHFGNFNNAILSILSFDQKEKSIILIGVPIVIGFWGVIKFIIKKLYGYSLKELPNKVKSTTYFNALIKGQNISKFRDARDGWGTHFGFDYRNIDKILTENSVMFSTKNSFTTRFYSIKI